MQRVPATRASAQYTCQPQQTASTWTLQYFASCYPSPAALMQEAAAGTKLAPHPPHPPPLPTTLRPTACAQQSRLRKQNSTQQCRAASNTGQIVAITAATSHVL